MREVEASLELGWCAAARRAAGFVIALSICLLPAADAAASSVSVAAGQLLYQAGPGEINNPLVVTETADDYTVTDAALVTLSAGAGCSSLSTNRASCPKAGIQSIRVDTADLNDVVTMNASAPQGTTIIGGSNEDTLTGGPGSDTIDGGLGGDTINAGPGNDIVDTGLGAVPPVRRTDTAQGGLGRDVLTYGNRTSGVVVDLSTGFPTSQSTRDADGTFDVSLVSFETLIGGAGNDEIFGGTSAEIISGGPGGDDTLCGGLGVDTVDYSRSSGPVTVTLDGSLPTDARLTLPLTDGASQAEYSKGRKDCREVSSTNGQPIVGGQRDCVPNDGAPSLGERDCVGEDVENVIGSQFDDHLTGNAPHELLPKDGPQVEPRGANELSGGAGNDFLDGLTGPDIYNGGDGRDTVNYASRNGVQATIDGAPNDGDQSDFDVASRLSDSIGGDVEILIGSPASDTLKGGNSDDVLEGRGGPDFLDGGAGDDQLVAGDEPTAAGEDDVLAGGPGDDTLDAGPGDDFLDGGDGNDQVSGGTGDDVIRGGLGADVLSAGDGESDVLDYSDATTPLSVTLDGIANDGRSAEGDNAVADAEIVLGGTDNDLLIGSGAPELISGGPGNDALDGGGGPDELEGGPGSDTARYADRSAAVTVSLGIAGGDGEVDEGDDVKNDVENVLGGNGDDVITGDGGANVLHGGPGADRISGAEGPDQLGGQDGRDTLNGDEGDDTLHGGAETDTLSGGGGADSLDGWQGNDLLDGGPGPDRLIGGDGVDTVDYSSRSAALTVDTLGSPGDGERGENDVVNSDVESVRGGRGNDTIDIADGATGSADCGGGVDRLRADVDDDVASSCEAENVRQSSVCVVTGSDVRISRSGVVPVKVTCAFAARGTLQLNSVGRVRLGKNKLRKVKLGSKSFAIKIGNAQVVRVKASRTARRAIKRNKRMKVRALLKSRRDVTTASRTNKRTLTVKLRGKR